MPSAVEKCREPSGNCQGISHFLESGHPDDTESNDTLQIDCVVMMSITVEDYETQYWPKLENAIQHLLTTKPSEYIPISYEQMYTYVAAYQLLTCIFV